MLKSPYDGDWNFGPLPTPTQKISIAVVIPERFIGVVRQSASEPHRWVGNDGSSLSVSCERGFWCFCPSGSEWSPWEETNVWWQVV